MNNHVDESRLRETLHTLKPNGALFEIRVLIKQPRKKTISGYFTDVETAVKAMQELTLQGESYFVTLNDINRDCYSRLQHDKFVDAPENTTSDTDIDGYRWILVDLDPVRATGVSSSADELEKAHKMAKSVYQFLKHEGFEEPVIAMSGNGYHLLYRVALLATEENTTLVQNFLQAVSLQFSDEEVKVDTANFNPSRICKLYGTYAQKGAGTDERPHRMAYIVSRPNDIKTTPKAYIEKVAGYLPKEERPQRYNNYQPAQFNVVDWMSKHGIRYKEKSSGDYTKYILDECPFDHNHKAPDSMITVGRSGAIGFRCLHNSCQNYGWHDLRLLFEPDAYDNKYAADEERINRGWREHKAYNRDIDINYTEPDGPMFYTMQDILNLPQETEEYIPCGYEGIDNRIGGLKRGGITVVTGLRGGSKTTAITDMALAAVNDGYNVIFYSGEQLPRNFMRWLMLKAAGPDNVKPRENSRMQDYVVPDNLQKKIADWMDGRLLLYNNDYGNNFKQMAEELEKKIADQKTDIVFLDNLMALDIRELNPFNKYDAQKEFVCLLAEMAKRTRTHIVFVAHPRKASGFLRLDDISGTGDLANMVDNAFIVHRNNADFQRLTKEMFKWKDDHEAYTGTNVIEIAKDREYGFQDVFVPLHYDVKCKRLKNGVADVIHYKWENDFLDIDPDADIPF